MNATDYNGVAARKRSLNHDLRFYIQRNRHGIMSTHGDWRDGSVTVLMSGVQELCSVALYDLANIFLFVFFAVMGNIIL